jgi:hypothetical protein
VARVAIALALIVLLGLGGLYAIGRGWLSESWHAGRPQASQVPPRVVARKEAAVESAALALAVEEPKQILFGDLHVHTTFSADAFQMSLPMSGGDGAHPVSDACDFARYCSLLDFWSINDHAITSTPQRWSETVESIRQCNAVAGDPADPDTVAFLGWEWTQIGSRPENHYGHKNVVLRDLEDGRIPTRPIAAGPPPGTPSATSVAPSTLLVGLLALQARDEGGLDMARYLNDMVDVPLCPSGRPVRDLPDDCREEAVTPADLFAKLDDWGHASLVIPHGTTWGMYTPPGSAWDKQLAPGQHDPARQGLIEIFSGHGNSEEYRPWREVVLETDGSRSCPAPTDDFLPSCWRAGEIIAERCREAGEPHPVCEERATEARRNWVYTDRNGGLRTVPGTAVSDWQDAGQCRDCFQPSFNYRPRSAVQYIMALRRPDASEGAERFRFGFLASSDNHSARPGTGYKEVARSEFTEARFGTFPSTILGRGSGQEPEAVSRPFDAVASRLPVFAFWETERGGSFFLNGGLTAVHANGRDREAVWDALLRREVYGTSGPRILLWFELVNGPGGARVPMGGEVRLGEVPVFEVRAAGSFEQKPGCAEHSLAALSPTRIERLCQDECYHPSDVRRAISRIEVVRIRPQQDSGEAAAGLIEDPWKVLPCPPSPAGCRVVFSDEQFRTDERDALYYVRAIEEPSLAVAADPLGCRRDESGRCIEVSPCFDRPTKDDCLAESEERAWSSPIFVDFE